MAEDDIGSPFGAAQNAWRAKVEKIWRLGPRHLHHYTTGPGLHGILSSHSLRGGNFAFMNDRSEFQYAKDVFYAVVDYWLAGSSDSRTARFLNRLREKHHIEDIDLYITCFCEQEDLLSQWRGYGSDDSRYCLRFDSWRLGRTDDAISPPLRVIYDSTEQKEVLDALIREHVESLAGSARDESMIDDAVKSVYAVALPLIATFKDRAFAGELEWRHVLIVKAGRTTAPLSFASSNGVMKPYRTLVVGSTGGEARLPLTQVIAGAARFETQVIRSARMMLDHYGYADTQLETSRVPLQV